MSAAADRRFKTFYCSVFRFRPKGRVKGLVLTSPLTIPISPADMPSGVIRCSKINSVCGTRLRLKQSSTNSCLFYPRLILPEGVIGARRKPCLFPRFIEATSAFSQDEWRQLKMDKARTIWGSCANESRSAIFNQSRMYPQGRRAGTHFFGSFLCEQERT